MDGSSSSPNTERRERDRQAREERDAAARTHQAYVASADATSRRAAESNNPDSRSNKLRAEANKLYKGLDGLAPVLVSTRLSQTEGLYKNALSKATTPLERSSAAKNLAVLSKRTITLSDADGPAALKLQVEALKYYVTALIAGSECQSIVWMDEIFSAALELINNATGWRYLDMVRQRPSLARGWPEPGEVLSRFYAALPLASSSSERSSHVASLKAQLSLSLAKHLHAEAVAVQESGSTEQEWRRALQLVGKIKPLLATASDNAGRAGNEDARQEAEELMEAAEICEAICRSTQARHSGDAMLKHVLGDSEELNMEGLRLVADFYREAISLARDRDLESEARAHRALGHLYCNVLRMTQRGLEHYKTVLQMGVAMAPRVVYDTDWHQEARAAVLDAQQRQEAEEERQRRASRAPFLEELKAELQELGKAALKGAHVLVRHVYEKHPPPGLPAGFVVTNEMVLGANIKDTLRRAVIAYHPDKQVSQPRKWQVLAEEITKELSAKYQDMK